MERREWLHRVKAAGYRIEKDGTGYVVRDADDRRLRRFRRKYEAEAFLSARLRLEMKGVESAVEEMAVRLATAKTAALAVRLADDPAPAWTGRLPAKMNGHAVYRAVAADETVLYVGVTNSLWKRIGDHRATSAWWPHARDIDWALFPTRTEAEEMELVLIRKHQPPYNFVGIPVAG